MVTLFKGDDSLVVCPVCVEKLHFPSYVDITCDHTLIACFCPFSAEHVYYVISGQHQFAATRKIAILREQSHAEPFFWCDIHIAAYSLRIPSSIVLRVFTSHICSHCFPPRSLWLFFLSIYVLVLVAHCGPQHQPSFIKPITWHPGKHPVLRNHRPNRSQSFSTNKPAMCHRIPLFCVPPEHHPRRATGRRWAHPEAAVERAWTNYHHFSI